MGVVYHGSKEHSIKRLEPRKSTHGVYVYATTEKVLALNFSSRCGNDLTYDIGHFDTDKSEPWELVENIPGAFEKMYANSSSIYSLSDETFKDIHTGFTEVVSEVGVDVMSEEVYENVYDALLEAEQEGLVIIYRYPNKPVSMKQDGSDLLDKWRFYKDKLNKGFTKDEFDRMAYLHPELLTQINDLSVELGYDYFYQPNDLITIFKSRIDRQLANREHEEYIDSAYISICNAFPELRLEIDELYKHYNESINNIGDLESSNSCA